MGIRGLMKMIRHYAPNAVTEKEYSSLSGSVVALDMLLTMYKFMIAMVGPENNNTNTNHIHGLLCKINNMLKYGIIPVPVFDGKPPLIKRETLQERRNKKKSAKQSLRKIEQQNIHLSSDDTDKAKFNKRCSNISNQHIADAKKVIELFGFISVQAPEEADSQCAALNASNFVDAVVTEDMDVLAFGTNKMLRKFSNKNKVVEINYKEVLDGMKITKEQFIDLCIILGTDYCEPIKGLNITTTYDLYTKCGNMMDFITEINRINQELLDIDQPPKYKVPDDFVTRWQLAKEYYMTSAHVIDPAELVDTKNASEVTYWTKPDKAKLMDFLCGDNKLDIIKVSNLVDYAVNRFEEYMEFGYLVPDWSTINGPSRRAICQTHRYEKQKFVVLGKPGYKKT